MGYQEVFAATSYDPAREKGGDLAAFEHGFEVSVCVLLYLVKVPLLRRHGPSVSRRAHTYMLRHSSCLLIIGSKHAQQ